MAGTRHAEYVVIQSPNPSNAVKFYTDVLGFVITKEEKGTIYLGCGLDTHFDVAFTKGSLAMDHVGVRVDELDHYEDSLKAAKISFKRSNGKRPNIKESIAFRLPNGANAELVTVDEKEYLRPNFPKLKNRNPFAPFDLDHVTMHSTDCKGTATKLNKAIGFLVSDARDRGQGKWGSAFMRYDYHHHDLAFLGSENKNYILNHIAYSVFSIDHMRMLMDKLCAEGYTLESGPVRHILGNNISCYFWCPDGNRVELTCEVAEVSITTPPHIWPKGGPPGSGWGGSASGGGGGGGGGAGGQGARADASVERTPLPSI